MAEGKSTSLRSKDEVSNYFKMKLKIMHQLHRKGKVMIR